VAIGWLAAFKAVPWPQVIEAAPIVVRGARELWQSVKRRDAAGQAAEGHATALDDPQAGPAMRISRLEARVAELEHQQAASSELIKALAEQNATLVDAVEILRVRTRVLAICGAGFALALAGMLWVLLR
jgi:hypothetical protein